MARQGLYRYNKLPNRITAGLGTARHGKARRGKARQGKGCTCIVNRFIESRHGPAGQGPARQGGAGLGKARVVLLIRHGGTLLILVRNIGWFMVICVLLCGITIAYRDIGRLPEPPKYYRVIGENWIALMEYDGRLWFTFDMEGK